MLPTIIIAFVAIYVCLSIYLCFPGGSVVKNLSADAVDQDSIPELGRFPGERNDNPCQHSCLEKPRDRELQRATVHGIIRVRHDLVTKHQQIHLSFQIFHLKSQKNTVSGLRQWFVQQGLQVGWQKKKKIINQLTEAESQSQKES